MRSGFTLVELAIVLVIIGLIIGAVLTGQDLIWAANVRKTVGLIEKYNTAVQTFIGKYNCLPGDCSNAESLGILPAGDTGDNGDGNDEIGMNNSHEFYTFWYMLRGAGLMAEPGLPNGPNFGPMMPIGHQLQIYSGYIVTQGPGGVLPMHTVFLLCCERNNYEYSLSPIDAQAVDAKMDDGLAYSGKAFIVGDASGDPSDAPYGSTPQLGPQGGLNCAFLDPSNLYQYNTTQTDMLCNLAILTTFAP